MRACVAAALPALPAALRTLLSQMLRAGFAAQRVLRTPALPALSRTLHATGARLAEAAEANRPAAGTMEFSPSKNNFASET